MPRFGARPRTQCLGVLCGPDDDLGLFGSETLRSTGVFDREALCSGSLRRQKESILEYWQSTMDPVRVVCIQ